MLPKDIMKLIEIYNDHKSGIFFKFQTNTYWYNGKRCERFPSKYKANFVTVDFKSTQFPKAKWKGICRYVNCLFKKIKISTQPFELRATDNNEKISIPSKEFLGCGRYYDIYDDVLYAFSDYQNEKYDFKTNSWSIFAQMNIGLYAHLYLVGDLFIFVTPKREILTYNTRTDLWQKETMTYIVGKQERDLQR